MSSRKVLSFILVVLTVVGTCGTVRAAADEKALWDIWKKLEAQPQDLPVIIADCKGFIETKPSDQLLPIVESMLAWCYFKTGNLPEGAKLLLPMMKAQYGYTPTRKSALEVARTWLTRIDRDVLRVVLQLWYNKHMAYPEKYQDAIDMFQEKTRAAKTDRWGRNWEYELVGFQMLTKVPKNQKYSLKSSLLGDISDYVKALEVPYASGIDIEPMKMGITTPGKESVYFKKIDDKTNAPIKMDLGELKRGFSLGYVGQNILAVTDGNHWKLMSRPRP